MERRCLCCSDRRLTAGAVILIVVTLFAGCSESKPRSKQEIDQERMNLPSLFMTSSGKQIKRPSTEAVFVDEETGELAWPVYYCPNPDCPARKQSGEPNLFIWTDPRFYAAEDGSLGMRDLTQKEWRDMVIAEGGYREPTCEACLKAGNIPTAEGADYEFRPQTYVLPETAQRMKELDEEHKAWNEYIRSRMED